MKDPVTAGFDECPIQINDVLYVNENNKENNLIQILFVCLNSVKFIFNLKLHH